MRALPLILAAALLLSGCGSGSEARPSAAAAGLRYAVLGDSYSNGESVGEDAAWPTVMAKLLTADGLRTTVVANPSVTGASTARMLDTGLPPIDAAHPDVMTVMLGVNDQVQGHDLDEFAADYDRAITQAVRITGDARRVIAVDIPDYSVAPVAEQFGDRGAIAEQLDAFNTVVRRVAARHRVTVMSVIDISRRLGARGIAGDGLHPSAAQLRAWAQRIAPVARRQWRQLRKPRS